MINIYVHTHYFVLTDCLTLFTTLISNINQKLNQCPFVVFDCLLSAVVDAENNPLPLHLNYAVSFSPFVLFFAGIMEQHEIDVGSI